MEFNGCNKCIKASDPTKGNCFMSATGYKECIFDMFKDQNNYVCPKDEKEADCNINNDGARKVSACGKCVEVKELKSTIGEKVFKISAK